MSRLSKLLLTFIYQKKTRTCQSCMVFKEPFTGLLRIPGLTCWRSSTGFRRNLRCRIFNPKLSAFAQRGDTISPSSRYRRTLWDSIRLRSAGGQLQAALCNRFFDSVTELTAAVDTALDQLLDSNSVLLLLRLSVDCDRDLLGMALRIHRRLVRFRLTLCRKSLGKLGLVFHDLLEEAFYANVSLYQ